MHPEHHTDRRLDSRRGGCTCHRSSSEQEEGQREAAARRSAFLGPRTKEQLMDVVAGGSPQHECPHPLGRSRASGAAGLTTGVQIQRGGSILEILEADSFDR